MQSLQATGVAGLGNVPFPGGGAMPGLVAAAARGAGVGDPNWVSAALLAGPNGASSASIHPAALQKSHASHGCSIYIKGLPEDADKLWLYEKFSRFGGILSVRVLVDDTSGKCAGIGFVNFTDPGSARAAHETMNGVGMGERLLHVMVQSASAGAGSKGRQQPELVPGMYLGANVGVGVPGLPPHAEAGHGGPAMLGFDDYVHGGW